MALNSVAELLFASGDEAGFFCELAQQLLFAQQPGLHAFWIGASETMHVRAFT